MNDLENVLELNRQAADLRELWNKQYGKWSNSDDYLDKFLDEIGEKIKTNLIELNEVNKLDKFNFILDSEDKKELLERAKETFKLESIKLETEKKAENAIANIKEIFENRRAAFEDLPDDFFECFKWHFHLSTQENGTIIIKQNFVTYSFDSGRLIEPLENVVKRIKPLVEEKKKKEKIQKLKKQKSEIERELEKLTRK